MSGPVQPPLTVETIDGATVGRPITRIKVTNGTLAVSGSTATLTISGGGGGSGTVTSVGLTETGSALTITGSPVTTSGTINIAGAGTSSQVILGDLSLGTLTSGTIGGSIANTQVAVGSGSDTISGSASFTYSSNVLAVSNQIELSAVGAGGILKNSESNQDLKLQVTGTGNVRVENQTTNAASQFNVKGNGTGTPLIYLSSDTKAVTLLCDENQKIKVDGGGGYSFVFDASSATGGITFPDSTVQLTAATGGGGSPGGSNTQIQYNNSGSFGGISIMTYDDTATAEKIEIVGSSTETLMRIEQSGTGDALEVHDQASDTTVFKVDQSGHVQIGTTSETIGALRVKGYQGSNSVSGVATYRISRLEDGVSGSLEITSSQSDSDMYISAGSTGADIILATRRSSPSTANYENIRLTSNGEIGIEGSNFGSSGQVLTSGGVGNAVSWTTPSGGGGIGGSITDNQVAVGATTADDIEGNTKFTYDSSTQSLNIAAGTGTGTILSGSSDMVIRNSNATAHSKITLGYDATNSNIKLDTDGTGLVEIHKEGSLAYSLPNVVTGANDYVLTAQTDGSTAWAASGGGLTPRFSGIKANSNAYYDLSAYPTGWRTNAYTNYLETQTGPIWCPFTCGIDLTVSTLGVQVTTAGATGLKYFLGVYSTDSDGLPDTLLVKSEVVADVTGAQAATVVETTAGDADLVAGVQYWYCYTRNTQSPSSYATLRSGSFEFTGNITDSSIGSQRQSIRSGTTGTLPLTYSGSGAPIGNANAIVGCTYA